MVESEMWEIIGILNPGNKYKNVILDKLFQFNLNQIKEVFYIIISFLFYFFKKIDFDNIKMFWILKNKTKQDKSKQKIEKQKTTHFKLGVLGQLGNFSNVSIFL